MNPWIGRRSEYGEKRWQNKGINHRGDVKKWRTGNDDQRGWMEASNFFLKYSFTVPKSLQAQTKFPMQRYPSQLVTIVQKRILGKVETQRNRRNAIWNSNEQTARKNRTRGLSATVWLSATVPVDFQLSATVPVEMRRFWTFDVATYSKTIEFFTIAYTCVDMKSRQVSWFSDFV